MAIEFTGSDRFVTGGMTARERAAMSMSPAFLASLDPQDAATPADYVLDAPERLPTRERLVMRGMGTTHLLHRSRPRF